MSIRENTKHWQHQLLVRMWNDRKSYFLMVGLSNGTTTLEDSLAGFFFFYFLQIWTYSYLMTQQPCTSIITQINQKLMSKKKKKKHAEPVYRSFLHDSQILEATKMFFRRSMDKNEFSSSNCNLEILFLPLWGASCDESLLFSGVQVAGSPWRHCWCFASS